MRARDVMTRNVVTVGTETPITAVARLMADRGISGVPVVDMHNKLVGMVTESDLLRRCELGTDHRPSVWRKLLAPNAELAVEFVHERGQTAGEVMTSNVIKVTPDTALTEIVDIFEKQGIRRVPVVQNGETVGIVSRANLVRALGSAGKQIVQSSEQDRRVRDAILAEFAQHPWGLRSESNVIVTDGIVHLWGLVNSREEQAALRVAAEAIPGVRHVSDHTFLVHDDWYPRFRHQSAVHD